MDEYLQQIYDDAFQNAYDSFTHRRRTDPLFTRRYMEGLLESLYVRQGDDWLGRGEVRDREQSAMISAAETILQEWDGITGQT